MSIDPERLAKLVQALKPTPWMEALYPEQRAVASSPAQFKAVTLPRQTGKTILLAAMAAEALQAAGPDEAVLYTAKTRGIAEELMWGKLMQLKRQYELPWECNGSKLRIETPRGGFLLVRGAEGADPQEEREKLRGLKVKRALLDEPATYAITMDDLLADIIEPALSIPRGDVVVAGTPGFVCMGPWYEISTGAKGKKDRSKWARWHWSGDRNPHREPGYLEKVKAENGFTDDDPKFRIEYLGEWVQSDALQVFRFVDSRNGVDVVPGYDRARWVHSIGVDFGIKDATAFAVLASDPHSRDTYVVECFKETGKRPDQVAELTGNLVAKYTPSVLVGDGGNLGGNLYIEAVNARLGEQASAQMVAAQKNEKRAYIELCNNDFRAGRLKLLRDSTKPLQEELLHLPWANDQQREVHKGYDDHCADAMLYAWRHHTAYLHEAPVSYTEPLPGTPEYDAAFLAADDAAWAAKLARPWWER